MSDERFNPVSLWITTVEQMGQAVAFQCRLASALFSSQAYRSALDAGWSVAEGTGASSFEMLSRLNEGAQIALAGAGEEAGRKTDLTTQTQPFGDEASLYV